MGDNITFRLIQIPPLLLFLWILLEYLDSFFKDAIILYINKEHNAKGKLVLSSNYFSHNSYSIFYFFNTFLKITVALDAVNFGKESIYLPPAHSDVPGLLPFRTIPRLLKPQVLLVAYFPQPVTAPTNK